MRNKYPGTCYRCGETVKPGEGHFEKVAAAQRAKWPGKPLPRWLLQHSSCAIKYRDTAQHYLYSPDEVTPQ